MSQIHYLDLQIKYFIEKLSPVFIEVCQKLIKLNEERIMNPPNDSESADQQESDEKDLLLTIAKILETVIAQTQYLMKIKVTGSNNQQQEQVIEYIDRDYQAIMMSKRRKLYKVFAFGINAMITRHKSYKLQCACLRLLKRYYLVLQNDSKLQSILEDTILTCLQNFAYFEDIQKHKPAALFYYYLLNSQSEGISEQFRTKLREEKSLDILKFNPNFSSIFYVHQVEQEQPVEVRNLNIKSGYPLEETVQPKLNFKQYVRVSKPYSILHYNFTTQEYNIGFSIEKVGSLKLSGQGWDEQNNEEVVRYSICDSHLKPISGSVLLAKPGVYKVVWHNSYSYLKAKQLKYRLRVLTRKDASDEQSHAFDSLQISDLFSIDELSEKEDSAYRSLKVIYPSFVPVVRIIRNPNSKVSIAQNQEQSIVLLIEENRSYLRINKPQLHNQELQASDIYVQQLNHKQLEQAEYDASKFFSDDSAFTQVFIITQLKDYQKSSVNAGASHFQSKLKLRDYVIKAEKILYYTLDKTQFKSKIHTNAEFYFADSCDTLISTDIYHAYFNQHTFKKAASLYNCNNGETNILMVQDLSKDFIQVRDVSDLSINSTHHSNSNLGSSLEYVKMIFSNLSVIYGISPGHSESSVKIYEDDIGGSGSTSLEAPEIEDRIMTLREEALKNATQLRQVYELFRKGQQQQSKV